MDGDSINPDHEYAANTLTERIMREYFCGVSKDEWLTIYDYMRNYILYQQETNRDAQTERESSTERRSPVPQPPPLSPNDPEDKDDDSNTDYDDEEPPCAIVNTSDEENRQESPNPVTPWTRHIIDSMDVYTQARSLFEQYIPSRPFVGYYQFYVDVIGG